MESLSAGFLHCTCKTDLLEHDDLASLRYNRVFRDIASSIWSVRSESYRAERVLQISLSCPACAPSVRSIFFELNFVANLETYAEWERCTRKIIENKPSDNRKSSQSE